MESVLNRMSHNMKPIKIILNPVAGRGFSEKAEPEIRRCFNEAKIDIDLVFSERQWHAAELAEQAINDGYEVVVAVGGDGTTNEVINGLMAASKGNEAGTLGLIATGSGSDFSFNVGMPADVEAACQRIITGQTRLVDVGTLSLDDGTHRYFDNQLGIGFDGIVTVEAKKFKRLRGMALYLPVVLKTVFLTQNATRVTIEYDDKILETSTIQISVANGSREGGGFFMTPEAKLDDGYFDVCIVEEIGKLAMLGLIPKFMNGTHVDHKATTMLRAKKISITSEDNLISHFDGELLCTEGHKIECEIFPQRLRVIY